MKEALKTVIFGGVVTNRDYLKRILSEETFLSGHIHTHYIAQKAKELTKEKLTTHKILKLSAGLLLLDKMESKNVWDYQVKSFDKAVQIDKEEFIIRVDYIDSSRCHLSFNSQTIEAHVESRHKSYLDMNISGKTYQVSQFMLNHKGLMQLFVGADEAQVISIPRAKVKQTNLFVSEDSVQSPMPGKVFKILKKQGAKVAKGDAVLIVEAMKMEHTIKSPKDGTIKEFYFKEGEQVQGGAPLCDIV